MNCQGKKASVIATVIAGNVSSVDEVSFSTKKGSLTNLIAAAIGAKLDINLRDNLRRRWKKGLREEVELLLNGGTSSQSNSVQAAQQPNTANCVLPDNLYTFIDNLAGGSCFYRALSQAFFDTEDEHAHFRYVIVDHVVKNFETLKDQLNIYAFDDANSKKAVKSASGYRIKHSPSTEFATTFEVFVFNLIFQVPIRVYKFNNNINKHELLMQFPIDSNAPDDECVIMEFIDDFKAGHFKVGKKNNGSINLADKILHKHSYRLCILRKNCHLK